MLSYHIKNVKISFWPEYACQERIGTVISKAEHAGPVTRMAPLCRNHLRKIINNCPPPPLQQRNLKAEYLTIHMQTYSSLNTF